MRRSPQIRRVLAIDPTTRGFGFAVLEGADRLIDWGVKATRQNARDQTLTKVKELIEHYSPTLLVIDDCSAATSRRSARIRRLLDEIACLGKRRKLYVRRVSNICARAAITGRDRATKYEMAVTLAGRFPELKRCLPPRRKPWMSEDARMKIFEAVGMVATPFGAELRSETSELRKRTHY